MSKANTVSVIKLPSVNVIRTAKVDPYESFYLYFLDKLGICFNIGECCINQSAFTLSPKNEKVLANECEKWYWKHSDKKYMGKKWFHKAFLMTWLNYSPRIDNHKVVKDGYCMVDTKEVIVEKETR